MATNFRRRASSAVDDQVGLSALDDVAEEERKLSITPVKLHTAPLKTLGLFWLVCLDYMASLLAWVRANTVLVITTLAVVSGAAALMAYPGQYADLRDTVAYEALYVLYWMALGVASSIGLGSGLHTFMLFLGPHIIRVTVRAGTCNSVNFTAELKGYWPYPTYTDDAWVCEGDESDVSFLQVVGKVMWPAFLWGVGTALGELPPYFMARAARLSGEKLRELEDIEEEEEGGLVSSLPLLERAKVFMHAAIQRWGFWAILAAASIPNPLFDLAGITCGHFLIPFWTFFGATAVGKGVIKVSIQALFYVIVFSPKTLTALQNLIQWAWFQTGVKWVKAKMSGSMSGGCWQRANDACMTCCEHLFPSKALEGGEAKDNCSAGCGEDHNQDNLVATLWNYFILGMMLWFLASIITASANEKLVEQEQGRRKRRRADSGEDGGASNTNGGASWEAGAAVVRATDENLDVDILDNTTSVVVSPPQETKRAPRRANGTRKSKAGRRNGRRAQPTPAAEESSDESSSTESETVDDTNEATATTPHRPRTRSVTRSTRSSRRR